MRIVAQRTLRGPNFFARFPVIYMVLDIQELEHRPSDEIPGLPARIKAAIPSLVEHRCSPGVRGGFFQRIDRGTWAGHIVEHIAIELQCLAGMEVGYGKTRELSQPGVYSVVYRYRDEASGLLAGRLAVDLLAALIEGRDVDPASMVETLKATREGSRFGPSTASIVEEAGRRGIPHRRLNAHSHVMLGQGRRQRHIQASMTGGTTVFGVAAAADKAWTKQLLLEAGVAVPDGQQVKRLQDALAAARRLGWPLVVKPLDANHGRGITTGINGAGELATAYEAARAHHDTVIVERHLVGEDHRLLVVGGTLVAAARREPAHVVGDGQSTVRRLIETVNLDPRRGHGHERPLTQIVVDGNAHRMLELDGRTLDSVPPAGAHIVLKSTANLSTGGTATDVTDEVHPGIRSMAERVARIIGLDIIGIDIVAPHLHERLEQTGGGIVEVNAGPGLRMHLDPTHGRPRDVAAPIVDLLFPDSDGRIPTIAVSGTNGKTTTARLIAHCLRYAGARVGLATTDGVEVGNEPILSGDLADARGAQAALRDPTTTHAVLEVSRAGIIERGMGVGRVDVGILLNARAEQMGQDEVHDEEDIVQLAATVPDVARFAVLNVDDPLTLRLHEQGGLRASTVLCTTDPDHAAVRAHLRADAEHRAVVASGGSIEVWQGASRFHVADIADVPVAMAGKARCNVENVLAAVAACHALELPERDVRAGITTFNPTTGQNPGRMNVFDIGDIRVLLDRGGTVHAVRALDDVVGHLKPRSDGRVLRVVEDGRGRPPSEWTAIGAALALHCDGLWIACAAGEARAVGEAHPAGEAHAVGETHAADGADVDRIADAAVAAGLARDRIATAPGGVACLEACLADAGPGDLLVVQSHDPQPLIDRIRRLQDRVPGGAEGPP